MWLDTQLEKSIGLGVDFPWPDLKNDECVLNSDYRDKQDVRVGDFINIHYTNVFLWQLIFDSYNEWAEDTGEPKFNAVPNTWPNVDYNCTVVGFYGESYGKVPKKKMNIYTYMGSAGWMARFANASVDWDSSYSEDQINLIKGYLQDPAREF
jgi:hypothetical protein